MLWALLSGGIATAVAGALLGTVASSFLNRFLVKAGKSCAFAVTVEKREQAISDEKLQVIAKELYERLKQVNEKDLPECSSQIDEMMHRLGYKSFTLSEIPCVPIDVERLDCPPVERLREYYKDDVKVKFELIDHAS